MKLRTKPGLFALRSVTRPAWALTDLSRSLGTLGERLAGGVGGLALRWHADITEVVPLTTGRGEG
jgi:hypothetical protein